MSFINKLKAKLTAKKGSRIPPTPHQPTAEEGKDGPLFHIQPYPAVSSYTAVSQSMKMTCVFRKPMNHPS
jgi:hypothetical protein